MHHLHVTPFRVAFMFDVNVSHRRGSIMFCQMPATELGSGFPIAEFYCLMFGCSHLPPPVSLIVVVVIGRGNLKL